MKRKLSDFLPDIGNVVKNITNEILRDCSRKYVTVNAEVVSLAVSLLSLDPIHGLSLSSQINRHALERFVKKCVEIFMDTESISIKTLHMQVFYMESTIDPETIYKKYKEPVMAKTALLTKEISESEPTTKEEQEKLFKKICIDIILSNMLGNPSNPKVVTETMNALKSVMSRSDLINFISNKKKSRLDVLVNIREIVCGIRIFNKDAGHCGEGIRDVITEVTIAFSNTKQSFSGFLTNITKQIESISDALRAMYVVDIKSNQLDYVFSGDCDIEDFEFLKHTLLMFCQHQEYLQALTKHLNKLKKYIDDKVDRFRSTLHTLHDIVQYRTAVPTEKVFPHFIRLANLWQSLLDFLYTMVEINTINDTLVKITATERSPKDLTEYILIRAENRIFPTASSSSGLLEVQNPDCTVLKITQEINTLPQIKYCAYMFAIGNGLLVPAESNLGILLHEGLYYAFSCAEYGNIFANDIIRFRRRFFDTIRTCPEAIVFFDYYNEIKSLDFEDTSAEIKEVPVVKVDVDIQTEIHPILYNKDKNYTWNIWDLRRKAIQLVDLKKSKTNSAQTDISYFKYSSKTQTYTPRDCYSQTKGEHATNTSIP